MTDEDDDYTSIPEGVNERVAEAYESVDDALYSRKDQLGLNMDKLQDVRTALYGSVNEAVEDLADERDNREDYLVNELENFADYVENDVEDREELATSLDSLETELQTFADDIELHGSVPEERAQRTSDLVDDITGRDSDAETDGGWFSGLLR